MALGFGKVVMIFGSGKWGWTEEYFWRDEDATLDHLILDAKGLVSARRSLLSVNFDLEAVRLSVVDAEGNTFVAKQNLISYNLTGNLGPGLLAGTCTNPWLALLQHASTADATYSRNIYIRGLPSNLLCVTDTLPWPVPNTLVGPLTAFNNYLMGVPGANGVPTGRFQMRAKDIRNRQNAVFINDVEVLPNKHWNIFTDAPVPIYKGGDGPFDVTLGSSVHVFGPRAAWSRGFSGDQRVINPFDPDEPLSLVLSGCQARTCTIDYLQDALVAGVGYILVPIGRIDPARPISKSTGGPFFGTRGRASKKVCC